LFALAAGLVSFAALAADPVAVGPADWPWWRGPTRDGVAAPDQDIPLKWGEAENVVWKAPVPGRGHGSPTVVGDQVFLATAETDRQAQSVLCLDRTTGKKLWQTDVHTGGLQTDKNQKSSLASSTIACDGKRLFVSFLNSGAVYTTALDRDGKQVWQVKVTDFVSHQGYGASPTIVGPLVLVSADNKGGGAIVGLDRETGKEAWRVERPKLPNYTSPVLLTIGGKDQIILIGCDVVTSLDPLTGKTLWETKGATTECVTSTVTDGTHVFTTGGYPKNHVSAVRADGSGKVDWENTTRVYVPSMLIRDGYLYAVQDGGSAVCWKADTGKQVWSGRLGGTFFASPVRVGDHVLAINEAGRTYVFRASADGLKVEAENQLGTEAFASPVVCGNRVYLRVATTDGGKRQEWVYCVGK
jgi:outer membrane protein assembly factor BamB